MAKRTTVSDQLRNELEGRLESQAQIAHDSEVDPGVLSRFLTKKSGITDSTFSKLCMYLHLELHPKT
jgi:hypothetical protein